MASEFERKKERHASGESAVSTVSDYIPTPPDGGYGWVIVFASFVNHIIVDGIAFTFGVFYLEFLTFFGESKGKTALVGSLLCGCYLMTGPIAGALTNKFGCRAVCCTGGVIATTAFVLSTFSPTLNILILTYGVMGGFGFGLIYLPSVISVSYYFEKRRAVATGIAVCGAGVGCFMFAPIGRLLLETYDWKNAMFIVAGVVAQSIVMGMLMRPLEAPRRSRRPRRKNVLDRLMEQTKLKHSDSIEAPNNDEAILRVMEVKLARERMLREEEGGSEYSGSVPNSTLNSVRGLDRQNSHGVTRPINIPGAKTSFMLPNSLSSDTNSPSGPHTLPAIKIHMDVDQSTTDEKTSMLKAETPTSVSPLVSESVPNGSLPHTNGKTSNGSTHLPPSVLKQRIQDIASPPSLPSHVNKTGNGFLSPTHHNTVQNGIKIKSAQDIWALQARKKQLERAHGVLKSDYARPMYRKDIFYSGSVLHIPQFRSQPNVKQYLRSTTSIPIESPPEDESCTCLPKSARDILKTMLDLSIFKDPVFLVACLGNAFGMLGLYVPFVFMADRSIMLDIPSNKAAFLLSVIGITNTLGRVAAGFLADFKWVNSLAMHNVALLLAGVACILNMFATKYISMCVFSAFFGGCVATWISLTSIILCNLLGLEKLTNAFGLLTMVRGICSVAGPPLAGAVFDATKNYDYSFHVGGVMLFLAGLMFLTLHLPFFQNHARLEAEAAAMSQTIDDLPFPEDIHLDDELDPAPTEMKPLNGSTSAVAAAV